MPRSTIEMKALIKTNQKETLKKQNLEKIRFGKNKRREVENKKKDLKNMLSMNPFIRLFVLPKIS
tara:strand:- start:86 stop:280 length:195 start_codon:yes stop_codon:yes gene_type:complete